MLDTLTESRLASWFPHLPSRSGRSSGEYAGDDAYTEACVALESLACELALRFPGKAPSVEPTKEQGYVDVRFTLLDGAVQVLVPGVKLFDADADATVAGLVREAVEEMKGAVR
jgi:hypothetical protein